MSLRSRIVSCATAALLSTALTAAADPVRITSGSVVYSGGIDIPVTLSGAGFTFSGTTDVVEGIFTPRDQCGFPVCTAGSTVDLHSLWLGLAFHSANATYQGVTYPNIGSANSDASMRTEWIGSLAIPTTFTGGTLNAPVALNGDLSFLDTSTFTTAHVPLVGSGLASLTFQPYSDEFPNAFRLESLRFDITPAAATPEPASMLLMGTGVAGLFASRRRRRDAAQ